jgi:hypothetical protein
MIKKKKTTEGSVGAEKKRTQKSAITLFLCYAPVVDNLHGSQHLAVGTALGLLDAAAVDEHVHAVRAGEAPEKRLL